MINLIKEYREEILINYPKIKNFLKTIVMFQPSLKLIIT